MPKLSQSRPARWGRAAAKLRESTEKLQAAIDEHSAEVNEALSDLQGLQEEYREWQGNLPENLQDSATAGLLQEIDYLDIPEECTIDNITEVIEFGDTADQVELPRGFGRD